MDKQCNTQNGFTLSEELAIVHGAIDMVVESLLDEINHVVAVESDYEVAEVDANIEKVKTENIVLDGDIECVASAGDLDTNISLPGGMAAPPASPRCVASLFASPRGRDSTDTFTWGRDTITNLTVGRACVGRWGLIGR